MNIKHLNDGQLIVSTTPCSNYEQTCTLVIVVKESLNNSSIVINQVSDHSGSDEQLVKLPSDGKFIIYTIVIPTEDGICHVNYDKNKDFYYYSNGRVYLVKPTGKKSINLEDLI